jgi:hypothetical protein
MVRGFEVEPFGGSVFREDRSTGLIARSDRSEVQIVAAGFSRCLHWEVDDPDQPRSYFAYHCVNWGT